jgi:predicted transcriptional regulator
MLAHMMQFLIELDDRCARDLERVAPARKRMRAEFVRLAIRRAVDLALDVETAKAYAGSAVPGDGVVPADLTGWDPDNALARKADARRHPAKGRGVPAPARPRPRRPPRKRAA